MVKNRKFAKTLTLIMLSAVMVFACAFAVLADDNVGNSTGWERTSEGGWRYIKSSGHMAADEWMWIGEESTGYRCYFFDGSGNLVMNAITTDGYRVDSTGAWTENGIPVTRMLFDTTRAPFGNEITNGNAIAPITLSTYLTSLIDVKNSASGFPNRTYIQTMENGDVLFYTTNNAVQIKIQTDGDMVVGVAAPAYLIFSNFPQNGIEQSALAENLSGRIVSSGSLNVSAADQAVYFDAEPGSFVSAGMILAADRDYEVIVCLTRGTDGNYYVYPSSPVFMKLHIVFNGNQILGPAYQ